MSTTHSRSHVLEGGIRRLVHLAILIGVIVGVRACGGTTSAEDRLGAGTQWFAERTGLTAVKEKWDKSIRPPIAAMTNAASDSLYRGVARTIDNAETATEQGAAWIANTASNAVDAVANALRRTFLPGVEPAAPPPRPTPQGEQPVPAAP
jgi:hypothetical protein